MKIHVYLFKNLFSTFRNFRQTCQQLSGLDLSAWQSDEEPEFTTEASIEEETEAPGFEEINESVIKAAIEKAKVDLNERARFEYESWLNSKCSLIHLYSSIHNNKKLRKF